MTTFSMDHIDYNLRSKLITALSQFLAGASPLEDLQSWVLSNLQTVLESGDSAAIDAVNALDADFVELGEQVMEYSYFIGSVERWINRLQTVPLEIPSNTKREAGL